MSQRAELLGQLVVAQFDIEQMLGDRSRSGAGTAQAEIQLQNLSALMRLVGTAHPTMLAALRGEISAAVAHSATVIQQSRSASPSDAAEAHLIGTTARTRATIARVADELFERRVLDPYLQFRSPEDEVEYRKREAERDAYIRAELNKGTPEGARNAAHATLAQINDAGAHGADRSPDFDRLRGQTVEAINDQRAAEQHVGTAVKDASQRQQGPIAIEPTPAETSNLGDIAAALRAAGVTVPSTEQAPVNVHNARAVGSLEPAVPAR